VLCFYFHAQMKLNPAFNATDKYYSEIQDDHHDHYADHGPACPHHHSHFSDVRDENYLNEADYGQISFIYASQNVDHLVFERLG